MSLPAHVCASRATARGEQYVGQLDPAGLDRLTDLSPQDIEAEINFRFDVISKLKRIDGWIKAQLSLECQVCMRPYPWTLETQISLVMVSDEAEEARLLADCEPVMVEDDRLMVHQMIEDEVLLALPLMRRCRACDNARRENPAEAGDVVSEDTHRPLAALKNLSLKGESKARRK